MDQILHVWRTMMPLDLTKAERALLIDLVVGAIVSDHFRMSERAQRLRAILAKLRGNSSSEGDTRTRS
jgi:hypothetical protein